MALGKHGGDQKTFLTVGFGKLRQKSLGNKQKVDETTPGAVRRETKDGSPVWALEFDYVTGIIENIFYKEDQEYGNTFEVLVSDVADNYQISFKEDSQFWTDFMKKLPHLDLKKEVKITPYDFTDKEGKTRKGTSVEQDGEKVLSYYEVKGSDGKWQLLHGCPSADGVNFKDKDDAKVYFIKVKKFLRKEFKDNFEPIFKDKGKVVDHAPETPSSDDPDDLPF